VLYDAYEVEMPEHVAQSVLQIRTVFTEILGQGRIASDLADSLRTMRAACRKFLASIPLDGNGDLLDILHDVMFGGVTSWRLNQALGVMRGVFGAHVAQIAVKYGIDIEEPLVSILPLDDGADDSAA
jgi:hypothetical protein